MGNICGKQEPEDRLGPGRPLGSAPPTPHKSSVPNKARTKQTYHSEARVVGGSASSGGGGGGAGNNAAPASQAAKERWSNQAMEDERKKQEALKKKKLGGARVLTAKEREAQDKRRQEIEANDRQVQGQIS
ncbi:hypothetical protein V2A60_000535 [Cordyceps javanica]